MTNRLKIIFTISVLLNVLLIGMISGNMYHHIKPKHIDVAIDDKTKSLIHQKMKEGRPDMRLHMKQTRAQKSALEEIITAPEFNIDDYKAVTKEILASKNQMGLKKADRMGEVLQSLSQEERQQISKKFLKNMMGGHKKPRHHRESHKND